MRKLAAILLLVAPAALFAHGDDDIRFVAPHGADRFGCDAPTTPCRSIGYAAGQAGKGGVVRIAEGIYELATQDDLFYLMPDAGADVTGGYSADFASLVPSSYPTVLVGVPVELRETLEARGFQVITDTKWDGTGEGADSLLLAKNLGPMLKSASAASCVDGTAAGFTCNGVDLLSHLALVDLDSAPSRASDVWGFVDLNTEREYALVGLQNGLSVIDVTDATAPVEVGRVDGENSSWRDVKVVQRYDAAAGRWHAYAYLTTDAAQDRVAVVDLWGLPNRIGLAARATDELSAHNVNISGIDPALAVPLAGRDPVLYLAGSNRGGGSFRAFSLAAPESPALLAVSTGGYMHDGTAVQRDDGSGGILEVLADFNEGEVALWNVTSPATPQLLATHSYATAKYVHSGSWSEDGRYLFVHDEFDERDLALNSTAYVIDADDLDALVDAGSWTGETKAIDHNGYARGNRYYISNYARGLTVLDISDPANPVETGYFDTFTVSDEPSFSGAWGVYPHLPSRAVLISDIQGGLFVLDDRTRAVSQGALAFDGKAFAGARGTTVNVPVARTGGTTGAVSVGWEVIPGTGADAGIPLARGRLEWPDGDGTFRHAALELPAGTAPMQRFFVRLFDPKGGATLGATVYANVFAEAVGEAASLTFLDAPVVEADATRVLVTVTRIGRATGAVSVDYATVADTAAAGSEFVAATGTLEWADGDATARVIQIEITADDALAEDKAFTVSLSNPQGAALDDAETTVVVTPVEVDEPPPPPPPPPPGPPVVPSPPASSGGGVFGIWWVIALASALPFRRGRRDAMRVAASPVACPRR